MKTASQGMNCPPWFNSSGKATEKGRAKAKVSVEATAGVIMTAEIGQVTRLMVGQTQRRKCQHDSGSSKSSHKGWDTGRNSWTRGKAKGKNWQTQGKLE